MSLHLDIEGLRTWFYAREKHTFVRAVDGVDLRVNKGETLGVVGESGSGKSMSLLSVMGLVDGGPGVIAGRATLHTDAGPVELLDGLDRFATLEHRDNGAVVEKDEARWRSHHEARLKGVRGKHMAMIFQNPKAAFHPCESIGRQIAEAVRLHAGGDRHEARERTIHWLERVRIDSPHLRFDNYVHALSGGMAQRAMVAMALAAEPALLIADEPTTGLDATVQAQILALLAELQDELGLTLVVISHDIGVMHRLADRIAVMYAGTVMEQGAADEILADGAARHPYTQALLAAVPSRQHLRDGRLQAIPGEVPDNASLSRGCRFYGRCQMVNDAVRPKCATLNPPLAPVAPGRNVRCWLHSE